MVEHGHDVRGKGAVRHDCFHNHLLEGSFSTSEPYVAREALDTLGIAEMYNVYQGTSDTFNELLHGFLSSYCRAEKKGRQHGRLCASR